MTVTLLLNGDEPDATLKNRLSPADDTLTLIKHRSRVRLLDFVTRSVWGRWSCRGGTMVSRCCGESGVARLAMSRGIVCGCGVESYCEGRVDVQNAVGILF